MKRHLVSALALLGLVVSTSHALGDVPPDNPACINREGQGCSLGNGQSGVCRVTNCTTRWGTTRCAQCVEGSPTRPSLGGCSVALGAPSEAPEGALALLALGALALTSRKGSAHQQHRARRPVEERP